jgi:hypothetical protein
VGPEDSSERAFLLATLAIELTFAGRWERRVAMCDEALAIARRLGDPTTLAHVLTLRFGPVWMPATLDDRLETTVEAVRRADELGDPWLQFQAVRWRLVALIQSGAVSEAMVAARREQELAERLGDPASRWMSTYDRGTLALIAGRLDEAEAFADAGLAVSAGSGPRDGRPMFASLLTIIRYDQGRLAELQAWIAGVVAENPGIPAFRALLALAYAEGELQDEARNLLAVDARTGFAEIPDDPVWLMAHGLFGYVAADVGDRGAAADLYDLLAPWHDQVVYAGVGAWGYVDHVLGRLATVIGRFDAGELHLSRARDRATRFGAPIWLARAQLDLARLLLARDAPGDRERAIDPLEQAIAGTAHAGASTVERHARSLREHQRAMEVVAASGQSGQRLRLRGVPADPAVERNAADGSFEREGDSWAIRLRGSEVRIRHGKGVEYLARLLEQPEIELHALDLQGGAHAPASVSVDAVANAGLDVRAGTAEIADAVLDPEAKRRYRERIDALREEIDEAERFNDPERASRAREEHEQLAHGLAAAVGIGGRDRKLASASERARVNVTRALRTAINRIGDHDPSIGGHLEYSVRTGAFCAYRPPPGQEVNWTVSR